jgi:subtilisin-like proprotein convertase family protein
MKSVLTAAILLLIVLISIDPLRAQTGPTLTPGSNLGPIPDGLAVGPLAYGQPRDILFNVQNRSGSIDAVRVFFRANHTFVGDLRVELIAPDGRSHLLFERTGATSAGSAGYSSNLIDSVQYFFGDDYDGISGVNWWTAADIGDGDIGPASLFNAVISGGDGVTAPAQTTSMTSTFRSAEPNGTWILRFQDGWAGDAGEVIEAELLITATGQDRVVTTAADSGAGSLREALTLAQAGEAIRFSDFFDSPRTINLQSALPLLPDGVGLFGPSAIFLNVRRDGAADFRVFELGPDTQATISGITISNGAVPTGQGGGILSSGRLTVVGSLIRDNVAQGGGGITNLQGDLTLLRCTIVGNSASFGAGVRSRNNATALIDNTTISAQAGGDLIGLNVIAQGGSSSTLILRNSTLTDAGGAAGTGLLVFSQGPNSMTSARISNSLFAFADQSIETGTVNGGLEPVIISEGFNLATDGANGFLDQVSDRLNARAPMQPLMNNGGGILVHRPLLTSDALDNGRATGPRLSDQTGIFDRVTDLQDNQYPNAPGGDGSDIGAFELLAAPTDSIFSDRMEQ